MKNAVLTLLLCVFSVFVAAAQKSVWRLVPRGYDAYLSEYGGAVRLSPSPSGDESMWLVDASDDHMAIRITNKKTGHSLIESVSEWVVGGFGFDHKENAGWYTLTARGSDSNCLCVRDGAAACISTDRNSDYSSQWTFVRVDSEKIPYSIGYDTVEESSFLGEKVSRAISDTKIESNYHGLSSWSAKKDISAFPKFRATGNLMIPALYNMAIEEMLLDIRPQDGTFMAGALWPDTWTRDVVYSIFFAYSWILPEVSRITLDKQTLKDPAEALQDTGSGGSYPISTDRVVWALAAWEYYLATGDLPWLNKVYDGLKYTALKDLHVTYDENIHLFRGETCSMDWRKHSYPNWFTNANIGESFSCGTNALHFFLYKFLYEAGTILRSPRDETDLWQKIRDELKAGINKYFWDDNRGLYRCYLYPWYLGNRPCGRVGDMSNGLAALVGAANDGQISRLLRNFPVYAYGGAVLYPSKPDSYAYHNKSVWPVWQTPLMYAAKANGNYALAEFLAESVIRSGAMFLTHKENMTYDTGYDRNTALNSDRQLWSVASYISMVYRILFGIEMTSKGLSVHPFIFHSIAGEISLTGFKYRNTNVNIVVKGEGSKIVSFKVNGMRKNPSYILPASARGNYDFEIVVAPETDAGAVNVVPAGPGNCWSPEEPVARLENGNMFWTSSPGCTYCIAGRDTTIMNVHAPFDMSGLSPGYYCVYSVNARGYESDLSNPVLYSAWSLEQHVGRVDMRESHVDFDLEFSVPSDGDYVLWFTGKNGRGPHVTFCTVRSLFLDDTDVATIYLEAFGKWDEVTETNRVFLPALRAGKHKLSIRLNPEGKGFDNNMSRASENWNDWIVESLKITAL